MPLHSPKVSCSYNRMCIVDDQVSYAASLIVVQFSNMSQECVMFPLKCFGNECNKGFMLGDVTNMHVTPSVIYMKCAVKHRTFVQHAHKTGIAFRM